MPNNVGMGYSVCPVCGAKHDEVVLLAKSLSRDIPRDNFMGFDLCPEHKKLFDEGYVALVECENTPTGKGLREQFNSAVRTGQLTHIRRSVATELFTVPIEPELPMLWVEKGVIDGLRQRMPPEGT